LKRTRTESLSNQIQRLQQRLKHYRDRSQKFSNWRSLTLVSGLVLTTIVFNANVLWGWLLLALSISTFSPLVVVHRKLKRSIERYGYWVYIKQTQLARINLDWSKIPSAKSESLAEHPFASDLNLLGSKSLLQLLNVSVSEGGQQRLQGWLLQPEPNQSQILSRQILVKELSKARMFRNKLLLHTGLVNRKNRQPWQGKHLLNWLKQPSESVSSRFLLLMTALSIINIILFVLSQIGVMPAYWWMTGGLYLIIYLNQQSKVLPLLHEASSLEQSMTRFATAFQYLENNQYRQMPHTKSLLKLFLDKDQKPSQLLKKIARVASAASVRGNPLVWLMLNTLVPWDFIFLYQLNKTKVSLKDTLPRWLDAWYELEALCSLASFADLNPEYTFPVINQVDENIFEAKEMGHPLIPNVEKICNSFQLDQVGQMTIVTGSNMSGKSTFLRTVAVNFCLAFAGAPVNADHFETNLFRLFTCIQVSDSLSDGFSYFYAEVRRLKQLLVELESEHSLPLFFFIDEIFRGTNNQERLIGSRSYIKALVGKNGVGMISTHDLELVHMADDEPSIKNYHFRESVEDGVMKFDYQLHTGPCPTTNALKIMALEGLPVDMPE